MDGKIVVIGGARRPTSNDIPPPSKTGESPDEKTTPPVAPGEMMPPG
jgi:hypothetical protein